MKEYKVFLEKNKYIIDSSMKEVNSDLAKECEEFEKLLNSDYSMQGGNTEYGELHSITETVNLKTEEKERLFIFQRDVNLAIFNFDYEDKEPLYWELTKKEIKFIDRFKKINIDNKDYSINDVSYNINEEIIEFHLYESI